MTSVNIKIFIPALTCLFLHGAEAGIVCRHDIVSGTNKTFGYCVRLNNGQVIVSRGDGGSEEILSAIMCDIKINAFNKLEVSVVDDLISICVNGKFIELINDSSQKGYQFGLFCTTDESVVTPTTVKFKNFYLHYQGVYTHTAM